MTAEQPVVEITDLTKRYGELTALEGLTLSVHRGQILAGQRHFESAVLALATGSYSGNRG